jgi:hypothetical protein
LTLVALTDSAAPMRLESRDDSGAVCMNCEAHFV